MTEKLHSRAEILQRVASVAFPNGGGPITPDTPNETVAYWFEELRVWNVVYNKRMTEDEFDEWYSGVFAK